jgi:hypothetical protein
VVVLMKIQVLWVLSCVETIGTVWLMARFNMFDGDV